MTKPKKLNRMVLTKFITFVNRVFISKAVTLMRHVYFPLLLLFICSTLHAQEIPVKQDSLRLETGRSTDLKTDSMTFDRNETIPLRLPRLNPVENLKPQFTSYERHCISLNRERGNSLLPPVHWSGAASDFINAKSRTAVATMLPSPRLLLYSSLTLGLVETPFFGKGNYYNLNAGTQYIVSPAFTLGASSSYHSDFGFLPHWSTGIDASYQINRNLMIDGGITYMSTASNMFNMNQSAVTVDMHGRYRISDYWFLNGYGGMPVHQNNNHPNRPMMPMMNTPYYGGSVEHWFKPTMGVEAGMIWMRDMFSGKMRPQPKLELLFRPGR